MSTHVLTIFLLKEGVARDQLVEQSRVHVTTPIRVDQVQATLHTSSSEPRLPNWTSLFADSIDVRSLNLQTASASGALIMPMANRTFALTFGYGRHLINPLAIEQTFGLKATLNSVADDAIRSIDKKTFEGISTHSVEQASKDTSIGDFGLDVERDLVRAVAGTPIDSTLAHKLRGMDALTATCDVELNDLPELLQAFYAKSEETGYKRRFPWIDRILEVRDKGHREQLDATLVDALRSGGNDNIWLAIPDLIDWSDIAGFSYSDSSAAEISTDVHLRDYLKWSVRREVSIDALKRHRVFGHRATSDAIFNVWPVYQCIHAEITVDDGTYLLNGGDWYRIDKDFVTVVKESTAGINPTSVALPSYRDGEDENEYNRRLARAIAGARCLDRQLIQYGGGKSSIEFCDVYDPARRIIHVKRYSGSSVLSHLFAQGLVSATAFISDEQFRREVNKLLPPALRLKAVGRKPITSEFEIAFVIASRSARELTLPFFSQVTLRNAHTQLSNYGFHTTLTKVRVEGAA